MENSESIANVDLFYGPELDHSGMVQNGKQSEIFQNVKFLEMSIMQNFLNKFVASNINQTDCQAMA